MIFMWIIDCLHQHNIDYNCQFHIKHKMRHKIIKTVVINFIKLYKLFNKNMNMQWKHHINFKNQSSTVPHLNSQTAHRRSLTRFLSYCAPKRKNPYSFYSHHKHILHNFFLFFAQGDPGTEGAPFWGLKYRIWVWHLDDSRLIFFYSFLCLSVVYTNIHVSNT